jgi:hypothetical protein
MTLESLMVSIEWLAVVALAIAGFIIRPARDNHVALWKGVVPVLVVGVLLAGVGIVLRWNIGWYPLAQLLLMPEGHGVEGYLGPRAQLGGYGFIALAVGLGIRYAITLKTRRSAL